MKLRLIAAMLLALGIHAQARADMDCVAHVGLLLFSPQKFAQALAQVPGLKSQLLAVMRDPRVSHQLRSDLRKAIEVENPEILNLTDELRATTGLTPLANAVAAPRDLKTWTYDDSPLMLTESGAESFHSPFTREQGLAVTDVKPGASEALPNHPLLTLIHELGHVRFKALLQKQLPRICKRLPPTLCRQDENGEWRMNNQLVDLLDERYAHELELKAAKELRGKHLSDLGPKWSGWGHRKKKQVEEDLGKKLVKNYRYSDPQVVALAGEPLASILSGGPAVQEVDAAIQLYNDPDSTHQPASHEMPIALTLVRAMRAAERKTISQAPQLSLLEFQISQVLREKDGPKRVLKIFQSALAYAKKNPEAREGVLDVLKSQYFRRFLNREAGWHLEEVGEFTWADAWQSVYIENSWLLHRQNNQPSR